MKITIQDDTKQLLEEAAVDVEYLAQDIQKLRSLTRPATKEEADRVLRGIDAFVMLKISLWSDVEKSVQKHKEEATQ